MPREPRLLLSQSYYHVMTRGNNKMRIFQTHDDYQSFYELMTRFKADRPFDLCQPTLMPNHTHMLVRTTCFTFEMTASRTENNVALFRAKQVDRFWILRLS